MTDMPSETTQRAWIRLVRAGTVTLARIEAALSTENLPALGWYDALWAIERAGAEGIRPFELEQELLLPQYATSRLLARLERAALIDRRSCRDDRRGQVIVLTTRGRDTRRRMWPVYARAIQSEIGRKLSEEEAVLLARLLDRLIDEPGALSR